MHSVMVDLSFDAGSAAELFHELITSGHGAAQRPANTNVSFSGGLLAIHRVKRDQLQDVDRLQPEFGRNPIHAFIADESEMFLPQMQQRHGRASLSIRRIALDRFAHFPL